MFAIEPDTRSVYQQLQNTAKKRSCEKRNSEKQSAITVMQSVLDNKGRRALKVATSEGQMSELFLTQVTTIKSYIYQRRQ